MAFRKALRKQGKIWLKDENLLLPGGSLLGSRLLSSGLLGSWLFGSSWLLGSLGFLGSWLLSSRLLSLLGSRLLLGGLWLLGSRLLGGQLEGSSSLLTSSSGSNNSLGLNHLLESNPDSGLGLGSINLVVGADVLEDGLSGGSSPVLESLDGSLDQGSIGRVGSGCLGLGRSLLGLGSSSGSSHDAH